MAEFFENSAHLHILLNHVPTVGFGMGLGLFLIALLKRSESLQRTCLVIFFLVANVAIATYTTGNAGETVISARNVTVGVTEGSPTITSAGGLFSWDAGRQLKIGGAVYRIERYVSADEATLDRPYAGPTDPSASARLLAPFPVSSTAIRRHEDAALVAFVLMEVTGFFAWLALWQWRALSRLATWNLVIVSLLSLVTFGLMARAATLGGNIHHEEVAYQADASVDVTANEGTGLARSIGAFVNGASGQTWVWATCETLHFVGLCLLFTVVLLVDLRMLGFMKGISFAALFQLLPIGMLGFGLNLITGMMFFIAVPGQYVHNVTFFWKIVFVVLGGFNVLYFMLDDEPWKVGAGDEAPLGAKLAAGSAIFIWVAVLFCGHMLPFIGNAF